MPLELEKIRFHDGDCIVISGATDPKGAAEIVQSMILARDPQVRNVQIIAMDADTTLQSIPIEDMRSYGWIRPNDPELIIRVGHGLKHADRVVCRCAENHLCWYHERKAKVTLGLADPVVEPEPVSELEGT
jgi:hypothetical protein